MATYHKSTYYNDYGSFLEKKFGEKVYKISLDAGFTCPNIDGTITVGGCVYCNNESFSPPLQQGLTDLEEQFVLGIERTRRRFKAEKFIAYYQAYTNTHAPVECLEQMYREALKYPEIVGLSIGTRPDTVDDEKLDMIEELAREVFVSIEYGLQTVSNDTLHWINRGHTYEDYLKAVEMTQNRGIHITTHIMLGFPTEDRAQMLASAAEMNRLGINGIKLHNLLVTRNTGLEIIYKENQFHVFEYEEYLNLVCDYLELLSPDIVVERFFATAPDKYLIAPRWNRSPSQMVTDLARVFEERGTRQGTRYTSVV